MSKLNILSVTLMASSVILSGCGGGSNTTDEAASTITPSQVTTDSSTSIVPVNKATSTSTAVILSGVQGISQIQTQKVQGKLNHKIPLLMPNFQTPPASLFIKV